MGLLDKIITFLKKIAKVGEYAVECVSKNIPT